MHNALIPRATIYEIEAARNEAVRLYGEAFDAMARANAAHGFTVQSAPRGPEITCSAGRDRSSYGPADRERFLEDMRLAVDRSAWRFLIDFTRLESLMDTKAKAEFRRQLNDSPPPVTAETCLATMEKFADEADTIFKRGVAEAFSALDRRFRSHDGFKVGSRVVLSRAMDDNGFWNHYSQRQDQMRDVERAFYVLDGKENPERAGGILGALDAARPRGFGARAYTAETEYFEARVFFNGNVHLWFKRKDLVERVNLLLADYYGATLGDGRAKDTRHEEPNRTPAKNFGFFETPEPVASRIVDEARIDKEHRVLEPQAGRGALARKCLERGAQVDCVEIQGQLVDQLRLIPGLAKVCHADFLDLLVEDLGLYDRIVMNPPFDNGRDIDHVRHALRFLSPGGRLVAVMSASVEFREGRKFEEFRKLITERGGSMHDLPSRSFESSGTCVNTVYVIIPGL